MADLDDYLERLTAAAEWALADERPAWQRAVARTGEQPERFRLSDLQAAKAALREGADDFLRAWLAPLYDAEPTLLGRLLELDAPALWSEMTRMYGVFGQGGDPLQLFNAKILSQRPTLENPLLLHPQVDGWGRPPE